MSSINVERPVLVERDRMWRARLVEEDCYLVAPDNAERRRLTVEFTGVKSELLTVKRFARHHVRDFNGGGAIDDLYHGRISSSHSHNDDVAVTKLIKPSDFRKPPPSAR
jgi:hypothetical protein